MRKKSNARGRLLGVAAAVGMIGFAALPGPLQAADLEVSKIASGDAWFPWIVGGGTHVAARINDAIFFDFFEKAAPPETKPALDHLVQEHVIPYGFTVLRDDGRILSLVVEGEGCGAYCEGFERAYAFDAANGRRLAMEDLFTAQGIRALGKDSHESALTAIRAEIESLRGSDDQFLSKEDKEDKEDILQQFERCAQWHSASMQESDVSPGEMRIGADGVGFTLGRCSNHALRALDNLGDFQYRVPFSDLKSELSAYGRMLILGDGNATVPDSPFGQVLVGTVGKAKVRVSLGSVYKKDGSFSGHYYYERYRTLISLNGQAQGDHMTLTEMDENSVPQAQWTLRRAGDGWEGTWSGNNGREFPIRLQ